MESSPVKTIKSKERIFISLQILIETDFLVQFLQSAIHFFSRKQQCVQEQNRYVTLTDLHTFTKTPIQKNIQAYAYVKYVNRRLLKSRVLIV